MFSFLSQPDDTSGENQGHNPGNEPIIRIKSVEKTSDVLEVEIASTILVKIRWEGEINERGKERENFNSSYYYFGPLTIPLEGKKCGSVCDPQWL